MRISDWSSDVCSSDLEGDDGQGHEQPHRADVAHAAACEVLAGEERRPRQQRPQCARQARVPVEDGVGEVAQDGGKVPHHAGHRLAAGIAVLRSEEHTSELQSLMRISYAVFCLKNKKQQMQATEYNTT